MMNKKIIKKRDTLVIPLLIIGVLLNFLKLNIGGLDIILNK